MNDPHLLVIFGGTGDLARRKLLPAYVSLVNRGVLRDSYVLGVGTRPFTDEQYRELIAGALGRQLPPGRG